MTATTAPCPSVITITTPDHPFVTENGAVLPRVELRYETWGRLNAARDNAVLVIHALTGDSHAAAHEPGDQPGWWEALVGPGKPIDTARHFVICVNNLGSCYGSTGPRSLDPASGRRYNLRFPLVTVRDLVRAQAELLERLGIERLHAVLGGSLGGMQVLEWGALYPERVARLIPIAASGRFAAQGIAYNEIQRRAIMLDPAWQEGEYAEGAGPAAGLALARMVGVITYQSDELMTLRFGRNPEARYAAWPQFLTRYDVEGYLHYQGDKLVRRFDANSYLYLTRAMDSHDLARGRGSYEEAFARIEAATLAVGIRSDILFPAFQVREIADILTQQGREARYLELDSPNGHDAFLNDVPVMGEAIRDFLER
ncbi:MAG TPA: homoserine O-acetyltransferase [Thermomicrobiaceae bacterium]|nr:homoserine O-acetyltransferase [Thermomicrobiaceae bacterium]